MAEGEEIEYQLETSDGKTQNTSKRFTGFGKAKYPNESGDKYDGEFVEGFRTGWGAYEFGKNKDTYVGQYEHNMKHGLGKMTYSETFAGGEGEDEGDESTKPRGGTYNGYFTKGKRGAQEIKKPDAGETCKNDGTFTYCNGDVYIGQWKDGKKHGKGCYTVSADMTRLKGEWAEGKICSGQWLFPNGTFYSGKFRYNKPFGKGVWVFKNGNQLVGDYNQETIVNEEDEAPPAAEGEEDAPTKDPNVHCVFKYGPPTAVKGEAASGIQKYGQAR